MTHKDVVKIGDAYLLPLASALYGLDGYEIRPLQAHDGGRNVVYCCEKAGAGAQILRIVFLPDRSRDDVLAEVEYIRYLYEHGGSVANVISSRNGNLLEELTYSHHSLYISLFEQARGKRLVDNQYRYRDGVPMTEYFYHCGKVLGKLHQLAKRYTPVHRRYSFFEKYTADYLDALLPSTLPLVKGKLVQLLNTLEGFDRDRASYGLVHFDYNDGNYSIDVATGHITVYDFDNACYCWYLYDLADLWGNGMGWIQGERDAGKRKAFMDAYFATALAGYRSETDIDEAMLEHLPVFINVNVMEGMVDAFEVMRNTGEAPACDAELSYRLKLLEDDIPYKGFFHEIYSCEAPFACEGRNI